VESFEIVVMKSATLRTRAVSGKKIAVQELSEVENAITADLRALFDLNVDAIRTFKAGCGVC
jgi:hypothetical protein